MQALAAPAPEWRDRAAAHRARAVHGGERRACQDAQARGACDRRGSLAAVDDGEDLNARGSERCGQPVGVVAVRGDHRAPPARDPEGLRVLVRRGREHHPGTVVVREQQRTLEGAGGGDHRAGADLPQPLAQHTPGQIGSALGTDALGGAHQVVVVDAERAGAQLDPNAYLPRARRERGHFRIGSPGERAPHLRTAREQQGARTRARRRRRGGKSRHTRADDEHVGVRRDLLVVIGVGRGGGPPQARHAPDRRLEPVPARPLEGLVVEPRGHQRRTRPRECADVEPNARPAVHALGGESLGERQERRAHIRRAARPLADIHQRARLLDAARPDAARAVELEAAAHQAHAVREQCRGQGIAPEARQPPPVEREGQGVRSIDPGTRRLRQASACHGAPPLQE